MCRPAFEPSAPLRERDLPAHTAATPTRIPEGNANRLTRLLKPWVKSPGADEGLSASVPAEAAAKSRPYFAP